MKITATRKEDILKRKADYDAKVAEYEADQQTRRRNYRQAEDAVTEPVREFLYNELAQFDVLDFEIDVRKNHRSWRSDNGLEVSIRCNDRDKFADTSALSWNYDCSIDEDSGEVTKESGSWSGLKATTAAQLDSLKQTVAALELLNSLDWYEILNKEMPKYSDYFDGGVERPERVDFNKELQEAEIEDAMGQNVLIKVGGISEYGRTPVWARFIKETPTQYQIEIIDDWTKKRLEESGELKPGVGYTRNVRKDKIFLIDPVTKFEL